MLGLVIGGLFLYAAQRKIDLTEVGHLLVKCDPYFIMALCLSLTMAQLLRSERWLRTFSRLRGLRRCPFFRAFLVGNAANSLLPGRAGDVIRAASIKNKHLDIGFGLAIGTVVVEKVADLLIVMAFMLMLLVTITLPNWVWDAAAIGGVALVSIIPVLLIARWIQSILARRHIDHPNPTTLGKGLNGIGNLLRGFTEAFHVFVHGKGVIWVLSLSLLIWLQETLSIFLGCYALGIEPPVPAVVLTVVMLSFGTMLPAAPGFVGTYQWFTVTSLGFFGVAETPAFTIGLLLNLSIILVNITAGMGALLLLRCSEQYGHAKKWA